MGGFELGIANSNINAECIGYSEIDKYAKSIYARHFPEHKDLGDATKINTEDLPDFDLLVGGFPCQAFSVAGHRKGFEDTRGTLFFEIARILEDKRPRYFLLENVRGLLSHDKGKTFQTILEVLTDMGYSVRWNLLNSKDFGVPQRRERVFIEGYFRGGSGREILSLGRNDEENTGRLVDNRRCSNRWVGVRSGRLHESDEILNTLTAEGQGGGGGSSLENPRTDNVERKLIKLNDKAQAQSVYDVKGLSACLSANGGGQGGKTGLYLVPKDDNDG